MADQRPRVIGLQDLLRLRKRLPEKPAPLVFFTDQEFARLIKGAVELPRRPRGAPLAAFEPLVDRGHGPGQVREPAGADVLWPVDACGTGAGDGVYFGCVCKAIKDGGGPPLPACRPRARPRGGRQISVLGQLPGEPAVSPRSLRKASGRVVLDCRCASVLILP